MMNLQTLGLAAAMAFAGAVLAQTPSPSTTTPESQTSPSTSSSEEQDTMGETSGSTTEPGTTQSPTVTPPISDSDTSGTAQVPTTAEEDPASAESESTRMAAAGDMSKKHDQHRVSKLIGKNIETSTGDTIGEVKDVVIDDQAKITHFIISHGRLGSTKLVAVPYKTVKQMMRDEKIVFEKTRLENAPSFEESSFPNLSSGTWSSEADRYWGRSRTASAESEMGSSPDESSGSMSSDSSSSTSEDPTEDSSSSEKTAPKTVHPPPSPY